MSAQEFWALTPVQHRALCERQRVAEEWQDFRAAQIVACLSNIYRDRKKRAKPFTAWDFMPSKRRKKARAQTPDEILTIFKIIAADSRKRKEGKPNAG